MWICEYVYIYIWLDYNIYHNQMQDKISYLLKKNEILYNISAEKIPPWPILWLHPDPSGLVLINQLLQLPLIMSDYIVIDHFFWLIITLPTSISQLLLNVWVVPKTAIPKPVQQWSALGGTRMDWSNGRGATPPPTSAGTYIWSIHIYICKLKNLTLCIFDPPGCCRTFVSQLLRPSHIFWCMRPT